jgi:proton-dependent oligopeptide transporter, POT family
MIQKEKMQHTLYFIWVLMPVHFLGILLCGYIGEKVSWSYGFGLAGIFMLFGLLQFSFAQKIFGNVGITPKQRDRIDADAVNYAENPAFQKPMEDEVVEQPAHITRDRLIVIGVFSFFTIFFWWAFEQAGGSMTIFAADYTSRLLDGGSATAFKIVNTLLTVVPMIILTLVLANLFRKTFSKYSLSNMFLGTSFLIVWGLIIWMLLREYNAEATEVPASWFGILNSFLHYSFRTPVF